MPGAAAPVFYQVMLTGKRLGTVTADQVLSQLQSRFKIGEEQARLMMSGRVVVKRHLDALTADTWMATFSGMGLEAVREAMAPPAARTAPKVLAPAAPSAPKPPAKAVPPQRATPAPAPVAVVLQGLAQHPLPNPRADSGYLIGLAAMTVTCLLLPVIYLSLTAGVVWGWGWYMTHLHHHLPRNPYAILFLYLVPGMAGAVLVLFLLKPIFASAPRRAQPVRLDPAQEPEFAAGIHALCRAIGINVPQEIHFSADVNASVHFEHGWRSLGNGRKVLTIGLPLMAGMTAREFVGVLAHEFGHFAQRAGMRCSFAVNSVNAWFERCAFASDTWDERLQRWSEAYSEDIRGAAVHVTMLAIGLTRRLMAGLFHVSFRLSQHMSRQMEFDADRYEALVAGSSCFRVTARNLRALSHAFREVDQANVTAWREGRLLRNIPDAVAARFRTFDRGRLGQIEAEMGEASTRYWDSHPADIERIENAEQQAAAGYFLDERPAAELMRNFASRCEAVTQAYYRELGLRYKPDALRAKEDILGLSQAREAQGANIERYFNREFQPWPLVDLELPADAPAAAVGWQECVDALREQSPQITRDWKSATDMEDRSPRLALMLALDLTPDQVGLKDPADRPRRETEEEYQRIINRTTDVHRRLKAAHQLYARRVGCAIASLPDADRQRAAEILDLLRLLQGMDPEAGALAELIVLERILTQAAASNPSDAIVVELTAVRERYLERGQELLRKTRLVAQTVTTGATIGGYLMSHCPRLLVDTRNPAHFVREGAALPAAFQYFYRLCLGELLALCERAEKAANIRLTRARA